MIDKYLRQRYKNIYNLIVKVKQSCIKMVKKGTLSNIICIIEKKAVPLSAFCGHT